MSNLAYIGLGSNIGRGKENLQKSWQHLGILPGITPQAISRPYKTAPVYCLTESDSTAKEALSAAWFTNAVGLLKTTLVPGDLIRVLQRVEQEMGRNREKSQNRIVDLDLLYYDNLVMTTPDLTLPHPGIAQRLFVLAPLAELAPDLPHPITGRTTREMLAELASADQHAEKTSW